ncbi:MAG: DUF456 domain-containing protein [bacterium]|nr:DUF456 domain-containing protein [bacterium]
MKVALLIGCLILMLAGIAGTAIPGMPGMPLVLLGVLVYAATRGLATVGLDLLILTIVLTVLTLVLDHLAIALGAGRARASPMGLLGAAVGGILGVVLGGFLGLVAGPPLGAILGEVSSGRTLRQGVRVAVATVIGLAATAVLKFGLAVGVVVMFLMRVT